MTLNIKKFRIPPEMVDKLKKGEELPHIDLDRAIKEDDSN